MPANVQASSKLWPKCDLDEVEAKQNDAPPGASAKAGM